MHSVGITEEQRELLAANGGLGLLGYLVEHLVQAEVGREVAQRREQALRRVVLLAHAGLERLDPSVGECDRALRDHRAAGDQHAAGDRQEERGRQSARGGERQGTGGEREGGPLRTLKARHPVHLELARPVSERAAHGMRDARWRQPEQLRHGREESGRVLAVVAVVADTGDIRVAQVDARRAPVDDLEAVGPVELAVCAHDVAVYELRAAQRSERSLERVAHVEIKYGGADVLSDLGIAKLILRGLPQRELRLEGEPAILVAQL